VGVKTPTHLYVSTFHTPPFSILLFVLRCLMANIFKPCTLFMNFLPESCSTPDAVAAALGGVKPMRITKKPGTTYAHLMFRTEKEAADACFSLQSLVVGGKKIMVCPAIYRDTPPLHPPRRSSRSRSRSPTRRSRACSRSPSRSRSRTRRSRACSRSTGRSDLRLSRRSTVAVIIEGRSIMTYVTWLIDAVAKAKLPVFMSFADTEREKTHCFTRAKDESVKLVFVVCGFGGGYAIGEVYAFRANGAGWYEYCCAVTTANVFDVMSHEA